MPANSPREWWKRPETEKGQESVGLGCSFHSPQELVSCRPKKNKVHAPFNQIRTNEKCIFELKYWLGPRNCLKYLLDNSLELSILPTFTFWKFNHNAPHINHLIQQFDHQNTPRQSRCTFSPCCLFSPASHLLRWQLLHHNPFQPRITAEAESFLMALSAILFKADWSVTMALATHCEYLPVFPTLPHC